MRVKERFSAGDTGPQSVCENPPFTDLVPEGRLRVAQDAVLGVYTHNDEKSRKGRLKVNQVEPRTASWVIFNRPCGTGPSLQSLPRTASWATLSRPSGTKSVNGGFSHNPLKPIH